MRYSLYDLPLLVLWLGWLAYWLVAAWYVKPTRRKESWASRLLTTRADPAGRGAARCAGSARQSWLHWLGARFLPDTMIVYWLGLLMRDRGPRLCDLGARAYLGRNWSGTVTVKENHELIRSGPYAIVRHPIYTGLLVAIFGTAIVVRRMARPPRLLLLMPLICAKLRREERFMSERFPDAYPGYRARGAGTHPILLRADRPPHLKLTGKDSSLPTERRGLAADRTVAAGPRKGICGFRHP